MADYAEGLRAARALRTHCEELKRGLQLAEQAAEHGAIVDAASVAGENFAAWARLIAVARSELSRSLERLHQFDGEVE